ncbi:MAG: hypothetical protein J6P64_08550 [Bacteroidales bacterium]|nr:hypothetical protein [Bacteroidales bacterium]
MKDYKVVENDVAVVAEPSQFYAAKGKVSKPGRMTVNEYFDEVWQRVVEKNEGV